MSSKTPTLTFERFLLESHHVELCGLGMRAGGRIPDANICASSHASIHRLPKYGRLDLKGTANLQNHGSWEPKGRAAGKEYLQVDIGYEETVVGVVTQGDSGWVGWTTEFKVTYGKNQSAMKTVKNFNGSEKIFQGNHDNDSHLTSIFPEQVIARYIRLYPLKWHKAPNVRMEVLYR